MGQPGQELGEGEGFEGGLDAEFGHIEYKVPVGIHMEKPSWC